VATITCNSGYKIESGNGNEDTNREVMCNETGNWNATHRCEPKGNYIMTLLIYSIFEWL